MNSYYNQVIDYSCINDYEGVEPQISRSSNLQPGNTDINNNNNNDFFLFNHNGKEVELKNECQPGPAARPVYKPTNYNEYMHKDNPLLYKQRSVESFQNENASLLNTIPVMNSRIQEANRNMKVLLNTDSSLEEFEKNEFIKEKAMNDKKYIAKQENQNEKMQKINKLMTEVEVLRLKTMKELGKLRAVQSKISGKQLAVEEAKGGNFLIKANTRCFQYEGDNNYRLAQCNKEADNQMFKVKPVANATDYQNIIGDSIDRTKLDSVMYPFYVVQPANAPNQCLNAGDKDKASMISIEPCQISDNQMWGKANGKISCQK